MYSQKLKNNIVDVKEKSKYTENKEENSGTEYGVNQITDKTKRMAEKSVKKFNQYGQKSVIETKRNIQETTKTIKQKIQNHKIKKNIKKIDKIKNTNLKKAKKTIKNTPKRIKTTAKMTKKTIKVTTKTMKKAYQIAKTTVKTTIKGIKASIKITYQQ